MPGPWAHLAARFFDVVTASALGKDEAGMIDDWLAGWPGAAAAFFAQPRADQRHGFEAARQVAGQSPERVDLVRAALLHDVGKRHSGLGAIGRVLASVALRLRLPATARWRLYRDHGVLAAAELTDMEPVVAEFARHHHGRRPPSIPVQEWDLLVAADRARVAFR